MNIDKIDELYEKNDTEEISLLYSSYPEQVGKLLDVYLVLILFPLERSGNVGDILITESCMELVKNIYEENGGKRIYFHMLFREDLDSNIRLVNSSKALILPCCAIRRGVRHLYSLPKNLEDIKVPIIPLGSSDVIFSGSKDMITDTKFNDDDLGIIRFIERKSPVGISCRDPLLVQKLKNNGIRNLVMTGDPAWYDTTMLRKPLRYNGNINRIVFTEPHYRIYYDQAIGIMTKISKMFPYAEIYYSNHDKIDVLSDRYQNHAKKLGFKLKDCSGDTKNLEFYKECDIHIGYRVHGHLPFLRFRLPSILFIEDSRGYGQSEALNHIGCLPAFVEGSIRVVADDNLCEKFEKYYRELEESNFSVYNNALKIVDETYEKSMEPFIKKSLGFN
jgi:hypothetical protein